MDIYVYSDESGVFDVKHNSLFVFGGLLFFGKEDKDVFTRKYSHAETVLRNNKSVEKGYELKAIKISNTEKYQLLRSMNNVYKFGVVIHQEKIRPEIFDNKKSKQRYLDYAYKIALKKALKTLALRGVYKKEDVDKIHIFVDEHSTATDGRYELREAVEQELKIGTFNDNYNHFFPPLFPKASGVDLQYCDSSKFLLVRSADIVANHLFYRATNDLLTGLNAEYYHIIHLPEDKDSTE